MRTIGKLKGSEFHGDKWSTLPVKISQRVEDEIITPSKEAGYERLIDEFIVRALQEERLLHLLKGRGKHEDVFFGSACYRVRYEYINPTWWEIVRERLLFRPHPAPRKVKRVTASSPTCVGRLSRHEVKIYTYWELYKPNVTRG